MARISADGQDYTSTWSLGTQANLTVCAWVKIVTDRNDYSTIFSVDNGTGDNWLMQTDADGTTLSFVGDATTQQGIGSMTVGTWYFIALATAGASGTIYYRTAATQTMSTVAVTGVTASVNAVNFRIGDSPWTAEWWNGCINSVKAWTAQLSAAEVANEAQQYVPLRTANLVAFHPLVQPETADYSGNSRTLSGGTGATREDGPPIPWRPSAPRLSLPPATGGGTQDADAALTGTGTATATAATDKPAAATATGTGSITASASSVKPAAATLTATGSVTASASTTKPVDATLTATGSRTATTAADKPAAASLTATGTLTATASIGAAALNADATLTATTSATATAATTKPAAATLTAAGARTAGASTTKPISVALTGSVTATGSASTTKPAAAALTATVAVTAEATVGELVDFVCQDFTGTATPVAHAGTSTVVTDGGTQTLVSYGGTQAVVSYGGTASICGR